MAYTFSTSDNATRAGEAIARQFELLPGDAKVADLADDGFVLAIRAREENLSAVTRLAAEHGGDQVVDIDEKWTGLDPGRERT